jgi:hypothetical protein
VQGCREAADQAMHCCSVLPSPVWDVVYICQQDQQQQQLKQQQTQLSQLFLQQSTANPTTRIVSFM